MMAEDYADTANWIPVRGVPGAFERPASWKPPTPTYNGPDIVGLVVNPDGVALMPGPIEDDATKRTILEQFIHELYLEGLNND